MSRFLSKFSGSTANLLRSSRARFGASVQLDRQQPFFDASAVGVNEKSIHEMYSKQLASQPPIIEPQFHIPGQFVMDPERYTIDCSKYEKGTVSTANNDLVQEMKEKYASVGLVYLVNTSLLDLQSMRALVSVLIPTDTGMDYKGGSNWRNYIEENVYDTGAPKEAWIHYHHEMAYVSQSPKQIAFCCKHSILNGDGSTFVSDQVQCTEYLLSTPFGQKLKNKGICYVRCLTDEQHYKNQSKSEFEVYNHWQKSFGTDDMSEATEMAHERGLKVEWDANHEKHGRYMKTKFYTDAYEYCPDIDKNVLFASVADDAMWFDTWPGLRHLPNAERPLEVTYGDDSKLTHDEFKQFVEVYDRFGIEIPWKVGDVAVMCNYRWAHGRPAYQLQDGQKRELGVVLGNVFQRKGQIEGKW